MTECGENKVTIQSCCSSNKEKVGSKLRFITAGILFFFKGTPKIRLSGNLPEIEVISRVLDPQDSQCRLTACHPNDASSLLHLIYCIYDNAFQYASIHSHILSEFDIPLLSRSAIYPFALMSKRQFVCPLMLSHIETVKQPIRFSLIVKKIKNKKYMQLIKFRFNIKRSKLGDKL